MKFFGKITSLWGATQLLLLFIFCITTGTVQAQLSGTYTVNPSGSASSTNYQNLGSAIGDLVSGSRSDGGTASGPGVSGAVTINISDGTYTGPFTIAAITGASSSNIITFQSASGDSSKVILTNASASVSTNNYTLQLNGADYITFKELTISRTAGSSTTYGRVVDLTGGATNNRFLNNMILGYSLTTGSSNRVLVNASTTTSADVNNTISNNYMKFGGYGIYVVGSSTNYKSGWVIQGNILDSVPDNIIYFSYGDRPVINDNIIDEFQSTSGWGIYITNGLNGAVILRNKIYSGRGTYGIRINSSAATSTSEGMVANNMISMGGTSGTAALSIYNTPYYNFYYNSVLVTSTSTTNRAFYADAASTSTNSNNSVLNNSFANTGSGVAYEVSVNAATTGILDTSDCNNLYVKGSVLGKYSGTSYSSLSAWQTASGMDANSVSTDPRYKSNTDLHSSAVALNGKAKATSVTTDIDGQTRNSTTPDIGADEFDPPAIDVGIASFVEPVSALCAGTYDVKVRVKNMGGSDIDSVTITYLLNGVQQSQTKYRFTLVPDDDTILTIGTVYLSDTAKTIKVYTSKPNDGSDGSAANDTVEVTRSAGMSGTYTIGSGKDYTNFTDAVAALVSRGLCAAATFSVSDGTYTEQITIPSIQGASSSNTITFQSASGDSSKVILTQAASSSSTNNFVVFLDGADYVTFRKINFQRTSTGTYGRLVQILNGASHNAFSNNLFTGVVTTSTTTSTALVFSDNDNDDYNTFTNNRFVNGSYGMYLQGTSSTNHEKGTVVSDNILKDFNYRGIAADYQDSLTVSGNDVSTNASTSANGIDLTYLTGYSVTGNTVNMIVGSNGFEFDYARGTSSEQALIANNAITIGGTSGNDGFELYYSQYVNVYHNSIYNYSSSTSANGLYLTSATSGLYGDIVVKNNTIVTASGVAIEVTANAVTLGYLSASDYNNLYTSGTDLGEWGTSDLSSLSDWRTASSQDANSISVDPRFYGTTDLHVRAVQLDNAGTPLTTVTTDIDGQARSSSTPDIGADEFTAAAKDLRVLGFVAPANGLCGNANTVLGIIVENLGSASQSGFTLKLDVYARGAKTTTSLSNTFSGSLASLQVDTLYFSSTVNTSKGDTFDLTGYHTLSGEQYAANDTARSFFVTLGSLSTAVSGAATVCHHTSETYSAADVSGNTYTWTVTGGSIVSGQGTYSISVKWGAAGTGQVKLAETNAVGCKGADSVTVSINDRPSPAISGDDIVCEAGTATYSVKGTSGHSYVWSVSGGSIIAGQSSNSVTVSWNTPGSVSVKETNAAGCDTSVSFSVGVPPLPDINFGFGKVCEDNAIPLTNTTGITSGQIASYFWDFGDGTTSTDSLPVKIYAAPGKYTIMLRVTSVLGCMDSLSKTGIEVFARPKAGFTATTVCAENSTQFTNTSVTSGGIVYEWSFGDGATSSDKSPQHVYAKGGQYTVKLRITNANGCRDSVSQTVNVNPKPVAGFSAGLACVNDAVSFTDETSVDNGTIQQYLWSFGDGKSSTDQNPVHTFASQGSFTITLITITDKGCSDTVTKKIIVYSVPQVGFNAPDVCVGNAMQFINQFVSASYKYIWDFGDGDSSNAVNPAHTYSAAGTYTVSLFVTNSNGCQRSLVKTVTVYDKPAANFSAGDVCSGSDVTFTDNTVFNGTAASWLWSFGDNTTSAAQHPAHTYTAPGTYNVTLVVTNSNGCQDMTSKQVTVHPAPVVSFQSTEVCEGEATKFTNLTTVSSGSIAKYLWSFGPNATDTSTAANPEFTFATAGSYNVTLTAITDQGCITTASAVATVFELPDVTFSRSRTHRTVTFTVSDTTYASYSWDFGDTTTSTDKNPVHFYSQNGTYTITLKVTSSQGCETVVTDTVVILITGLPEEKGRAFRLNVFPNPFTNATALEYELDRPSSVRAVLYDMQGREVSILFENTMQASGKHSYTIRATDMNLVSGTYLVRLAVDGTIVTKQIIRVE